eukprot:CAMPEP_0117523212 /NCGR_PEP_ID=MMETSP0784-20121206/34611_1 /TAXON_ID=39447 /ORGANISM="" /LENGTH=47 /DNA_ID= /DNA_START= /DNA_END= /DNA_ORIENTATION=
MSWTGRLRARRGALGQEVPPTTFTTDALPGSIELRPSAGLTFYLEPS